METISYPPEVNMATSKSCAVCGAACSFTCARCKEVSYCGYAHQRADWDTHKVPCHAISAKSDTEIETETEAEHMEAYKGTHHTDNVRKIFETSVSDQYSTVEGVGMGGEELCAGSEEDMGLGDVYSDTDAHTHKLKISETNAQNRHAHTNGVATAQMRGCATTTKACDYEHEESNDHMDASHKKADEELKHAHPYVHAQDSGIYDVDQGIGFEDHVYLDPNVTIEKQLLNKMKEFVQDVEKRNGSTGSGHWNHLVEMFGTSLEHAPHPHQSGEVIEYEYEIGVGDLDGMHLDMNSDLGISMKEVQSSLGLSCVASSHISADKLSQITSKHDSGYAQNLGHDEYVHTYVVGHGMALNGTVADADILIGDEGEIEEIAEVLLKSALRKDTHPQGVSVNDTYANEHAFTSLDRESVADTAGVQPREQGDMELNTGDQSQVSPSSSRTSDSTSATTADAHDPVRNSSGRGARTYASAHRKGRGKALNGSTSKAGDSTQSIRDSVSASGGVGAGMAGRDHRPHTRAQPYTHSKSGAAHNQMTDSLADSRAYEDQDWELEPEPKESSVRPFTSTREPAKSCAVCGKGCSSTCSRCRAVSYCGLQHQRQHWLKHKDACISMTSDGGTNNNNNSSSSNSNSNNNNNISHNDRDISNGYGGNEFETTGRKNLPGKAMSARRPGGYGPVYATDDRTGYGYPKGTTAPKWEFDYDWESVLCVLFESLGYKGPVAISRTSVANKKPVTAVGANIGQGLSLGRGRSVGSSLRGGADGEFNTGEDTGTESSSEPRLTCEAVCVARVPGADDEVYVRSIVPKPKTATVAARDIPAGELCLVEDPLLVVSSKDFVQRHSGYMRLSPEQQKQFMSLFHPTPGTIEVQAYPTLKATETYIDARFAGLDRTDPRTDYDAVDDMIDKMKRVSFIIDMNGLRDAELASADGRHNAAHVYAHASRLKHSCAPNCCRAINSAGRVMVRALRPIPKGMELTVSYLDPTKRLCSGADRQELLRRLGFSCECNRCEAEFDDSFGFYCPNPKCGPPDGSSLGKLDYNHCNGLDVNPDFGKTSNTGTTTLGSKGKSNKKKKPGKKNGPNGGAKNGSASRATATGYGHVFLSHELDRLSPCAQCGTQPDQRYVERCASYQNQLATKLADLDTDCHKFEDDEPFVRTLQFCHTARMSQNRVVFVLHDMCVDWYTNMCEFGKAANYTLAQIRYLTRVCPLDPAVTAYALERLADCMAGCVRPQLYYDQARLRVCANHYPSSYLHANDLYPVRTPFLKAPESEQVNQMYRLAIELLSYAYGSPDRQCVRDVCDKLAWFLANQ
ncbi:hypothetical protein SARC_01991 [Sphaeroforma arctica JP610]|uniref:MYND-type domain-containing protein n=1 Tax=Sphaeroforma arctica JP610 TaxID=667725 RepID=A0A0L0GA13_9EUKA|nr:hypothetical protein SARC_01991 [Sphaeroforma arctica JP610]KNC85845.1 hypothetical protein SARC_01991 [Sphaeroforma arctica JP610]|eukprot:XP_014159747.1 hypothetical protein SARC_01991 [Sphaeroforma arctica JP610]